MYTIGSDNVSYVIPLDHIDLGYLNGNIQIGDTVKQLWTPQHKEYSRFQLKAWRKDAVEDHEKKSVTITTMCHICKIAVPVIYIKEHNNSYKHKLYLKILHEALERAKKNINVDITSLSQSELSLSTYFCEICCMIIPKNDKSMHEKSTEHKELEIQDELIDKFCILYEDTNNTKNSSDDCNNNHVHENVEISNGTQLDTFHKYILFLKDKFKGLEVVDENFISLRVHGSTLKVHFDDFNGFSIYNMADKELVCLLCKCNVTCKDTHIWTDMHIKNVTKPLSDENCIRQISRKQAHCIVCNDLVKNVERHKILDCNHMTKLKNAILIKSTTFSQKLTKQAEQTALTLKEINKNTNNTSNSDGSNEITQLVGRQREESLPKLPEINKNSKDNNKANEQILDRQIEEDVPNLSELNSTDATKPNVSNEEAKRDLPNETHSKVVHYMMCEISNPKELKCRVCLCVVPRFAYNINDHLKGKNHKNKYKEYMAINKLQIVENGFYCEFCSLRVLKDMEVRHISSEVHKVNMETVKKSNVTYCETCCINTDTNNIEIHRNDHRHKQKEITAVVKNTAKIIDPVVGNKNYAAVTASKGKDGASVQTPKSLNNEIKNLQAFVSSTKNTGTSEIKTVQPSTSNAKETPLLKIKPHYHLKQTDSQNTLLCLVCDKLVQNSTGSITIHVNGSDHTITYENLLKMNKVTKLQNNFYCYKCNVPVTNKNEIEHLFGNRHRNIQSGDKVSTTNLQPSSTNPLSTSTVKNVLTPEPTSEINKDQTAIQHDSKHISYHFKTTTDTNDLICKVCEVMVPNTTDKITTHFNGIMHQSSYNSLMEKEMIFNKQSDLYCHPCDEAIPLLNDLDHIATQKHTNAVLELSNRSTCSDESKDICNSCFCEICSRWFASSVKEHGMSVDHASSIRKLSNDTLSLQEDSQTKSKITLKCNLCDCFVFHNLVSVMEHLQGGKHNSAYRKVLDINKICLVGGKLFCLACKDIIESEQDFVHIRSPNHTGNLSLMS